MEDKSLKELREFSDLVQQSIPVAGADSESKIAREMHISKLVDLGTQLSYKYAKDAYELWEKHVPKEHPVLPILKDAYARLTPEQKAAPSLLEAAVNAARAAAITEEREFNRGKIIVRVLDRIDAKFPAEARSQPGISDEMKNAAFYREIVQLFEEKDFPADFASEEVTPSLEEILSMTNYLEPHNNPEVRAELVRLADEYQNLVQEHAPAFEQLDFGNALEVQDAERIAFDTKEELAEYVAALAKDDRVIDLPNQDAVIYVDRATDRLMVAAKNPEILHQIEAMTTGAEAKEYRPQSSNNKLIFDSKASTAVPALSIALVRLKLNEKEIHSIQAAVREVTKPKPIDISADVIKRAQELRMQRRRQAESQANTDAAKVVTEAPTASQTIQREDAFTYGSNAAKVVPNEILRQYLKVADKGGDKFYLNSRLDAIAFIDKGNKLETKSSSENTAESLVLIADARGWDHIKVAGTEAFRREVWLEATARGIVVRGYTPTDIDKALVAKKAAQVEKTRNTVEPVAKEAVQAAPASKASAPEKAAENATAKPLGKIAAVPSPAKTFSGKLLEHGKAPFEFDKNNKMNYYVKYLDESGKEQITWGLDLERAMQEAGVKSGEQITLTNEGRKPVEVVENVKNEKGDIVGTKLVKTHRNAWSVAVARDFVNMTSKDFAAKHPDHAGAAMVREFAKKAVNEARNLSDLSAKDRARFTQVVDQKLAKKIENGEKVPALKLVKQEKEVQRVPDRERGRSR